MNRLLAIVDRAAADVGIPTDERDGLLVRIAQGVTDAGLVLTCEVRPSD